MPTDRGEPWSRATYNGFSRAPEAGARPPQATPAPTAARRPSKRVLAGGGVAVALALGLGLGFLSRPQLDVGASTPAAPRAGAGAAATALPGAAQLPITQAPPAPDPALSQAQGRLETLPPEMAQAARAPLPPVLHPVAPRLAPPAPAATVQATPIAPAAQPAISPADPVEAPAPAVRASFDCASARPGAEQAVCSDAQLAAADRRLAQAYRRALRSGADPQQLRAEQRDWMDIREDAASRSRGALASVYRQRIGELNDLADHAPPGYGY